MNKIVLPLILISAFTFANDELNLFNPTQKEIFKTKEKIINEDKKINEKDWLSNISISTTATKDESNDISKNASISFDQDIYRFGAISNIIDLAKVQEEYDLMDLKITFNEYLKEIYSDVLNAKISDLNIQKKLLAIENIKINLEIKKDEYKAGQTDVTDLNDTLMEKNALEEEFLELQKNKNEYLLTLKEYSNVNYKDIVIPNLKNKSLSEYLDGSKEVKLLALNEQIANHSYNIKKSDYLPTLSLTSNYGYDFSNDVNDESYNYGLKVTFPIDFSSLNELEKYRLNYLLSQKEKEQKIIKKSTEYEKIIENVEKYYKSNKIAQNDISLYEELLESVEAEYKAGYKAIEDVKILSNTKKMRQIDIESNNLSITLELLSIYY